MELAVGILSIAVILLFIGRFYKDKFIKQLKQENTGLSEYLDKEVLKASQFASKCKDLEVSVQEYANQNSIKDNNIKILEEEIKKYREDFKEASNKAQSAINTKNAYIDELLESIKTKDAKLKQLEEDALGLVVDENGNINDIASYIRFAEDYKGKTAVLVRNLDNTISCVSSNIKKNQKEVKLNLKVF